MGIHEQKLKSSTQHLVPSLCQQKASFKCLPTEPRCTCTAANSCQRESLKSGLYAGFRAYGMAACLL